MSHPDGRISSISEKVSSPAAYERAASICVDKVKRCLIWVWSDVKKPHLLWVKFIFLLQTASLVTLYPYLAVHLRSLGFTIHDASIVNAALPLADVLGPPAAGLLADKLGDFKMFMSCLTLLHGLSSLLLLTVPYVNRAELTCCRGTDQTQCFLPNLTTDNFTLIQASQCQHPDIVDEPCYKTTCCIGSENSYWQSSVFWQYLFIRAVLDILRASSLMLFEGAMVAIIKEYGGDYGLQKLFGTLGGVIVGPIAGKLIDLGQRAGSGHDPAAAYMSVIVLHCVIRIVTSACLLKLKLGFKPPAKKVLKNLGIVLFKVQVLAFLVGFLVAGFLWGFLENFLFWYLEEIGASKFLMGVSLAVGTLAGVPVSISSSLLIKKMGYKMIMITALSLYAVRLLGYSYISSPEVFVAFEVVKPICTTLLLIACFTFIKDQSPMVTAASMESIFGACYFGIGRGLGGFLGGFAIQALGTPVAYRVFALVAFAMANIYAAVSYIRAYWGHKKYSLAVTQTVLHSQQP